MDRTVKLKVLIVGAGLGGLSAAISCALNGHEVTLLERAPELAEVRVQHVNALKETNFEKIGAGLQLTPNSSRILLSYGLGPDLEKCWSEPNVYAIHRYSDGKLLLSSENWDVKMRKRYGAPFIDVHRGQLQLLMYRRALALGVDVRLGQSVQSVDFKTAEIRLESGETFKGDLVVGADGLWSVCRESLLSKESRPRPTGDLAYRITLTIDQVSDPELRAWIKNPGCHLWIGPKSHVVAYSMKANTMFNIVLLVPDDLPANVVRQEGDAKEMKALFQGWDPILTRFLELVTSSSIQKWKLLHLLELESWRNQEGNFVLLGDSCHPMLPYLAQGAASAIEDGAVLGAVLGKVGSRSQIPKATEIWQTLRKQRSQFLVKESYAQVRCLYETICAS